MSSTQFQKCFVFCIFGFSLKEIKNLRYTCNIYTKQVEKGLCCFLHDQAQGEDFNEGFEKENIIKQTKDVAGFKDIPNEFF